jgi:hypothetical protein
LLEGRDDDRRVRNPEAMTGWTEAKAELEKCNSLWQERAPLFLRDSHPQY